MLAQHVYVGDILFEQVPCDFDDERYNLSYTCVTCQNDELVDPLDGPGYRGEAPTVSTCTTWTAAGAAATINRTGWTDDFSGPTNARVSNNIYATAAMASGDVTKLLQGTSMIPSPTVPTGATLDSVRFRVEHSLAGGETKFPVIQDEAYVLVSGARVGSNLATLQLVPDTDTYETYTIVPPLPAGVTVANLNAGNVGFEIGYRVPTYSSNPANFNISLPPLQRTEGGSSLSATHTHAVTVTWIGGGSPPPYVLLNLTGSVSAGGDGTPSPTLYEGSASVTGINGSVASGSIEAPTVDFPGTVEMIETKTVLVALTAGVGTATVQMSGTVTMTTLGPGNRSYISSQVTAGTPTTPTAATLQIDAMEISACYSTT